MKNLFIVTLLIICMSATVGMAQTKKPTTTSKKPTTTVKSSVPKTTTKKTTSTTTTTTPVIPPPVLVEKKTTTTTTKTIKPTETKSTTTPSTTTTTTTTTQSSGSSKGKKNAEPKPERVREPKPERVREPNGSSGGVRFGIRAEANQFVSFEEGSDVLFSPGVNAGLIINIPINEKLSVQPEVLYSMSPVKGDISTLTGKSGDVATVTQNSILAPITLNFNLGNGPTKFMINPGGYAGYLLSVSSSQTRSGITESGSIDLTGIDKFSYGVVLGLGVKINGNFLIEARSFYDLKESNNKSILSTIGIGYMF
jgi:uncharacterized membrane protein